MAQNDIIVYNFLKLKDISRQMSYITGALSDVKDFVSNARNSASDYWQGAGYDAFSERVQVLNDSLNKLYEQIDESRKKLDYAIETEQQNEEEIRKNTVEVLTVDDIFNV